MYGQSVAEFVAMLEAPKIGQVKWLGPVPTAFDVEPSSGASDLAVDVTVQGVFAVDSEPRDTGEVSRGQCIDHVVVAFDLGLSSEDGSLEGNFYVEARVRPAEADAVIDFGEETEETGTFDVRFHVPDAWDSTRIVLPMIIGKSFSASIDVNWTDGMNHANHRVAEIEASP